MNDITRKGTGSMLRLTTSQSKGKAKNRGGGGTTYNCLYGEAPPKRGIFFRPQVYERGGISLIEVYKKEGKFVFPSVNRAKRADRKIYGCEKKVCFVLLSFSYLKDTAFTPVKRDGAFKSTYVQFVSFVNERYSKGVPFLSKMADKRVRGWTSGRNPPPPPNRVKICWVLGGGLRKKGRTFLYAQASSGFRKPMLVRLLPLTATFVIPRGTHCQCSLDRSPDPEGLHCCIKERL